MKNVLADVLLIGGMIALGYGVSMIWLPGGYVLGGLAMAVLAMVAGKKAPQSPGAAGSPP